MCKYKLCMTCSVKLLTLLSIRSNVVKHNSFYKISYGRWLFCFLTFIPFGVDINKWRKSQLTKQIQIPPSLNDLHNNENKKIQPAKLVIITPILIIYDKTQQITTTKIRLHLSNCFINVLTFNSIKKTIMYNWILRFFIINLRYLTCKITNIQLEL